MRQTVKRHKKNRGGRPAADPQNPRNVRIQVLVSPHEVERIDADRGDRSRSDWVGALIRAALKTTDR